MFDKYSYPNQDECSLLGLIAFPCTQVHYRLHIARLYNMINNFMTGGNKATAAQYKLNKK